MAAVFEIQPLAPPMDASLRSRFALVSASQLADCTDLPQAPGSRLRPRHDGTFMVGCAVTVCTQPGDQLLVQKAIDLARPGDVIVVDGGGFSGRALVGEIMATLAAKRGIAGFVVDGAVRDLRFLQSQSLPVFSSEVSLCGPTRVGPGTMNMPVWISGMQVVPGDIVVGDEDGVVTIPRERVTEILAAAEALDGKERVTLAAVRSGDLDRRWIDDALRAGGCVF